MGSELELGVTQVLRVELSGRRNGVHMRHGPYVIESFNTIFFVYSDDPEPDALIPLVDAIATSTQLNSRTL